MDEDLTSRVEARLSLSLVLRAEVLPWPEIDFAFLNKFHLFNLTLMTLWTSRSST